MLRILLASAAVFAATTAYATDLGAGGTPVAPHLFAANATLSGGYAETNVGFNYRMLGLEAHAGALANGFGVQGDAWAGGVSYSTGGEPAYNVGIGLHLNRRTDHALLGGLISVGVSPNGYNDTFINAALEAQHDLGQFTIGGQVGYTAAITRTSSSIFSLTSPDGWYGHAIGRWFATDDLMLAGDVGYGAFSDVDGITGDVLRWGARLEYKFATAPVSLFVNYRGYNWTQGSDFYATHMGLVGVSLIAHDQTLAARYRGAAGLDDRNPFYGVDYPQ